LLLWQQRSHVTLQVMPFEVGAYQGMGAPFMLLEFSDAEEILLYLEGLDEGASHIQPARVDFYLDVFRRMARRALTPKETDALISDAIKAIQ
jgi:hypothetical protein